MTRGRARTTTTAFAVLVAVGLVAALSPTGSGAQEAPGATDAPPEVQALTPEPEPTNDVPPADDVVPDQYLVSLDERITPEQVPAAAHALADEVGGEVLSELPQTINGFAIEVDEAGLAELAASDDVASVAANGLNTAAGAEHLVPCTVSEEECDPVRPEELWNLDRTNQRPLVRDQIYSWDEDGSGVDVYVLDSGIQPSHVGFGGRAEAGHDVFPGPVQAPPANGSVAGSFSTGGLDCSGHGTFVAGTVGADLYGVARGAHIIGVRVLNCQNDGSDQNVMDGIEWAMDDADGDDPDAQVDGPTVFNMSIVGPIDFDDSVDPFDGPETIETEPMAVAVQNAIDAGVTVVVAAGNDSTANMPASACNRTPAALPDAITVASSTQLDSLAASSNTGSCVDIVAPGDRVWSLSNVDDQRNQSDDFWIDRASGTSAASPAVAAAAAMVLEANPTFTPAQVRDALVGQATSGALVGRSTRAIDSILHTIVALPPDTPNRLLWVDDRTFADVGPTNPFFVDVEWMAEQDISTGTAGSPKPTYDPTSAVSRQAMSAFMYRLAGEPAFGAPPTPTFGDVSAGHPFYAEIEWMADEGITTGTAASPKPLYKPADPVSRQAMSAFMYRLAGEPTFMPPAANDTTFLDVSATHPFYAEIEWMADEGITTGTAGSPKPSYLHANAVSRQAMSAFMHRLADGPGVGV